MEDDDQSNSIHKELFQFDNETKDAKIFLHAHVMIDSINVCNGSRKCPPLESINNSPKLLHGVERLLHGNLTSARSVKEMNITSLALPHGLSVCKLSEQNRCTMGVFNMQKEIQKETLLYSSQIIEVNELGSESCLNSSTIISLFSNPFSWLAYIRRTESCFRSNLRLLCDSNIFVKTSKLIAPGEELFICEADIRSFFGNAKRNVPHYFTKDFAEDYDPNGHQCQRCGKVFAYRYYRDKHLKYTRCVDHGDRKYPCHLCPRSFEKRDRLRIHVLHVHEKHRPHQCRLCGKSFSQSSSLNKHTRVHSGERPYECPFCTKAFTASSILRTHIRQHSGEKPFQCRFCGRTFASHAAHDSHVRRTHTSASN